MLKRSLSLVAMASSLIASVHLAPTSSQIDKPKGDYVQFCRSANDCYWIPRAVLKTETDTTTPGKKPAKSVTRGPERLCMDGGASRACTSNLGNWSNSQQCYLRRINPQPPQSDPAWQGHTDGAIWACVREQGIRFVTRWIWLPGKPDTVVVDPITLVYESIAEMHLAPPQIKTAPAAGQTGLVNMPVWMWVTKSENTWGPIVRSASVPGLSVTATAQVKAINWSMGDGNTVRCEGPGTPYDKSMGVKGSPTCGHRYVKTSQKLPNCKYPVTAVAQWDITWQSTMGDTGQISMTQQAATQLHIGEAVPVLVDPGGGPVAPPESVC
jgi:hypothetical protein